MFNKFPYTNFHELNLDYFINKFNEIFTEWEQLNTKMLEWKAATDASNALWKTSVENGLAAWKTATEADLNARETTLRAELTAWKTATEADIGTWEADTLAALNAWKARAEATFEAIRVQAAASATAAQTAQTAAETAQTAAETAQTAAETAAASVSASAAQIATNTGDISELKAQLNSLAETQTITLFSENEVSGTRSTNRDVSLPAGTYILSVDSVDSTADGDTSNINFYGNGSPVNGKQIPRATGYSGTITLSSDVDTIYFYGKNTYPDSADAVFTFYGVKIERDTGLNERLSALESASELINNKVDGIDDVVSDMYDIKYNYFNKEDAVDGQYYSANVGDVIATTANNLMAGIIFPVESGKTYVLRRTDFRWYALDADKKVIANYGNNTGKDYLSITPTDSGVKYVAISWLKAYAPINSYMILDPGVSFGSYVEYPYSIVLKEGVLNASGVEYNKIYTVGATGDFTTFTGMLKALKDDTSSKTVYVQTGVYDIFTEIGGQAYMESLTDETWAEACDIVPQNTKIIGIGNVVLSYHPTNDNIVSREKGWLISPLNIIYSCEIENITIDCDNCRYGIHIEGASGAGDANTATVKLKNVRVNRSKNGDMGDHAALGCGIGHNAKWYFDECRFATDGETAIFSVHTNAPTVDSSAYIEFNNCVIVSSDADAHTTDSMIFSSLYLPYAVTNYVNISNCYTSGKIATTTTNVSTKRQAYDINVIGGTSYGIHDSEDKTSGYDIKNYGNNVMT